LRREVAHVTTFVLMLWATRQPLPPQIEDRVSTKSVCRSSIGWSRARRKAKKTVAAVRKEAYISAQVIRWGQKNYVRDSKILAWPLFLVFMTAVCNARSMHSCKWG